jgi:hypothetical protein
MRVSHKVLRSRSPDFAPSSETPDVATSGRPSSNLAARSDGRARNASRSDAGGSIGVLRQVRIAPA